jgi:hypothetical protein
VPDAAGVQRVLADEERRELLRVREQRGSASRSSAVVTVAMTTSTSSSGRWRPVVTFASDTGSFSGTR